GGIYECREVDAVQCADEGGRAGVVADVCDAGPDASRRAAAVEAAGVVVGHRRIHQEPAAYAGDGVQSDAGRGPEGIAVAACDGCDVSGGVRANGASGSGAARVGSWAEEPDPRDEQDCSADEGEAGVTDRRRG